MYNVPWQDGRVFQTPVGVLTASFLLRPNTMFHPEGEWSVRLILPPMQAIRLRQLVMPAHDDIVTRAKEMYLALPLEQQARRPFKENHFWQAASFEGGPASENTYFTFRLPTIDRTASLQAPSIGDLLNKPHRLLAVGAPAPASDASPQPLAAVSAVTKKAIRKRKPVAVVPETTPVSETKTVPALRKSAEIAVLKPAEEVATRVSLADAQGQAINGLGLEPDNWDAVVSFSIQQYWLRSFGAGVTLRLHGVQLFGLHQRHVEPLDELPSLIAIAN